MNDETDLMGEAKGLNNNDMTKGTDFNQLLALLTADQEIEIMEKEADDLYYSYNNKPNWRRLDISQIVKKN